MSEHTSPMGRVTFDTELQRHQEILRRAWDIGPRDNVLDVGCGSGETTLEAARLAEAGTALGVDISEPMIEQARVRAAAAGSRNVRFACADAAVHPFPTEEFDVVTSRFGTMFFAAPVSAFINLARALRHGGRLTMMVWQSANRNEWAMSIRRALGNAHSPLPSSLAAFSLGDPKTIEQTLESAGFVDIVLTEVDEPVYYGSDVAAALDWVGGFTSTKTALQRMSPADRERALAALRKTLEDHHTDRGVWFDSRAWLVGARRP